MKKFIFMLMMAMVCFIGANGQTVCDAQTIKAQTAYAQAKLLDNIYVGVHGGVNSPIDNTITPFNGQAGVKIGKNWSPLFGTNIEGTAMFGDNNFMNGKTFLKSHYVGLNETLNLTNLFCGYNPNKVFESSIELGIGWAHYYNDRINVTECDQNDLAVKTGMTFGWNLGQKKAWQIYAEPTVYWNLSRGNNIQFNRHNAQAAINVGLIYKFKTSNKTHNFKVYNIDSFRKTISALENDNKVLKAENAELKNRPAVVQEVVKETTVYTDNILTVSFVKNSAVLTEDAKAILNKIPVGSKVNVTGATSPEGTSARNTILAKERAIEVADYLKSRGVIVLSVKGDESGRVAIVTTVK